MNFEDQTLLYINIDSFEMNHVLLLGLKRLVLS